MPSDKPIMAKATGLFFTVWHRFSPWGSFWHTSVHTMYFSQLTNVLLYVPVIFAEAKIVDQVVAHDGFFL